MTMIFNETCPRCGFKTPTYTLKVLNDNGSHRMISAKVYGSGRKGTEVVFINEHGDTKLSTLGYSAGGAEDEIASGCRVLEFLGFKKLE